VTGKSTEDLVTREQQMANHRVSSVITSSGTEPSAAALETARSVAARAERFGVVIAILVVTAACGGAGGSSTAPTPPPAAGPVPGQSRSTIDRPDDTPGNQVHVMYVLPSDGVDRSFDSDGTISGAVQWARNWFVDQTGGRRRVRFDTFRGELDITFLRTDRSDAQYVSMGVRIRDAVAADIVAAGFTDTTKIYSVFFGGGSPRSGGSIPCGQGAQPGNMSAVYLACLLERTDVQGLIPVHGLSKILGMVSIHEIFHNLGAVPDCAPHVASAHASDDPRDIMVASGSVQLATYREGSFVPLLDAGRDDYYEHARSGCVDIALSAFLE